MTVAKKKKSPPYIPYSDESMGVERISIGKIRENPTSSRPLERGKLIEDLTASIKDRGLLNPIHVVRHDRYFELRSGGRRLLACKALGHTSINAIIKSPDEPPDTFLIDNLLREDLDPISEARGFERLIEEYGYTQQKVADRIRKSRTQVTQLLGILTLPEDILEQAASMVPPLVRAKLIELSQIKDETGQREAWEQVKSGASRDDLRNHKSDAVNNRAPSPFSRRLATAITTLHRLPDRLYLSETDEIDGSVSEQLAALKNAIADISALIEDIETSLDGGHETAC
ncbi:MAG: ParB/RepB/Spo0J family partition protein [Alphaproteobacteria bacterium]|jgi:ParB/RepB/Spo0J family partition protein